jgi:chemotaxis signal transduction protein
VGIPPKRYLTFRVARADLAVEAEQVRGILPFGELVRVPRARPGLLGVVTFSGRVVNVVDLAAKLHLPRSRPGTQPKIVVLRVPQGQSESLAGFVADRVSDVVLYAARNLRNGVLHGSGRPRHIVDFSRVVSGNDVAEMWAVTP